MKLTKRNRIIITLIITLLVWGHVIWDYFHGGIPVHYLFMDENMPPMPDWLGAIILPFYSWVALGQIHKRVDAPEPKDSYLTVFLRFLLALGVALTIAICFENGIEIPGYVLLSIFVFAFFFPLYRAEFVMGWVLGLSYTFGAIIPMLFGLVFAGLFFVLYTIGQAVIGVFKTDPSP